MTAVAFVHACWHRELVEGCRDGFLQTFAETEPDTTVDVFEVPGSFELPLHALKLARSGRYEAVVAAGLVVDGGIYRHEFVAAAVIDDLGERPPHSLTCSRQAVASDPRSPRSVAPH